MVAEGVTGVDGKLSVYLPNPAVNHTVLITPPESRPRYKVQEHPWASPGQPGNNYWPIALSAAEGYVCVDPNLPDPLADTLYATFDGTYPLTFRPGGLWRYQGLSQSDVAPVYDGSGCVEGPSLVDIRVYSRRGAKFDVVVYWYLSYSWGWPCPEGWQYQTMPAPATVAEMSALNVTFAQEDGLWTGSGAVGDPKSAHLPIPIGTNFIISE